MRITQNRQVGRVGRTGFHHVEAILPTGVHWDALALVTRRPAAAVLVVDEENGRIAFVRQGRVGALGAVVTEVPAGVVDPGEHAVQSAVREVEEETGLRPTAMELVAANVLVSPGYSDERMWLFIGRDLVPAIKRPADAHVELVWKPLDALDALIDEAAEGGDLKTLTLLLALSRSLRTDA
jgi:ADP-ribose pyrophosphatase